MRASTICTPAPPRPNCKKPWKNKKKQKKTKSSDPCPQPGLSPDLAHGSELFVFVFFVFLEVLAKLQKTMEKQKKTKKKVQTHVPSQASPQTLPMGLNFLIFFVFFVFFFHSFLHVFHVNMLSSQYLSKNARFYNLHTCAPQAKLQKKHGKPNFI